MRKVNVLSYDIASHVSPWWPSRISHRNQYIDTYTIITSSNTIIKLSLTYS